MSSFYRLRFKTQIIACFCLVAAGTCVMAHTFLRQNYRQQKSEMLRTHSRQLSINITNRLEYFLSYLQLLSSDSSLLNAMAGEDFFQVNRNLEKSTEEFRKLNAGRVSTIRVYRKSQQSQINGFGSTERAFSIFNPYSRSTIITGTYLNEHHEKVFSIFQRVFQANRAYLERDYFALLVEIVPFFLAMLLTSFYLAVLVTRQLSRRLNLLQTKIADLSSWQLSRPIFMEGKGEFADLAQELESTRRKILAPIDANNQTQEHMRIAEMTALRAQINSHFLFNSLSIIRWLALEGKVNQQSRRVYRHHHSPAAESWRHFRNNACCSVVIMSTSPAGLLPTEEVGVWIVWLFREEPADFLRRLECSW